MQYLAIKEYLRLQHEIKGITTYNYVVYSKEVDNMWSKAIQQLECVS